MKSLENIFKKGPSKRLFGSKAEKDDFVIDSNAEAGEDELIFDFGGIMFKKDSYDFLTGLAQRLAEMYEEDPITNKSFGDPDDIKRRLITRIQKNDSNEIVTLNLTGLDFTSLPPIPKSIISLKIANNKFTSLPELPPNLIYFDCSSNRLDSIKEFPKTLTYIDCYTNLFTKLPELPPKLEHLNCTRNHLTDLPDLPNSVKSLRCGWNPLNGNAITKIKKHKNSDSFSL